MSNSLYTKIYNFLVNAPQEHITAGSVIYQGIEENPWILRNELKSIVDRAVTSAKNLYEEGSLEYMRLFDVLLEVSNNFLTIIIAELVSASLRLKIHDE